MLFEPAVSSGYPTEKPVSLYETFILNSTQRNEIVFDPFSGSGTCAEAAENTGRHYVISDISQAAIEHTKSRLARLLIDVPDVEELSED